MSFSFEFKGGTSLSKGYSVIERFSEDIDIRIEPPADMAVAANLNQQKAKHVKSRQDFCDWLAGKIVIDGITAVKCDPKVRETYARIFDRPNNLFYRTRPSFERVMGTIAEATKMEGI